jgi:dipeptidyl aminopeptidase/acylaminoacyl peptidase
MNRRADRRLEGRPLRNETTVNWVTNRPFLEGQGVKSRFWLSLVFPILSQVVCAQSGEMVPPASVIHEGIPPVPASLGAETAPYRRSPGSSLIGWDPEKPEVIISGYCLGVRCASRVVNPGQSPQFLLKLPSWYRDISLEPGGTFLIYNKPIDENFLDQIYRYDLKTKETTLLTDGKSRNRYPLFSSSAKLLSYSSNRRNGRDLDVYEVDPLNPASTHMLAKFEGEDWAVFDWSPDDRKVILSDYKSTTETYLWILDIESGQKTFLTPARGSEKAFNGSLAFFRKNGEGVYFITDQQSEFRRLAYLEFASKRLDFLTDHIKGDIDEFALSPDGKTIAFVANQDGLGQLHLIDVATGKEMQIPDMPAGVVSGLKWHRRLPYIGFELSTARFASDVFSLNINTLKFERWTTASSTIKTDSFKDPELIKWKSFDGRMISGFLYRPPQTFAGKRPVIIDIHGGPASQFRPNFRGEDNYFIHGLGVAVIYPNVRGSTGCGKTFIKLDDGILRANAVKDIGALLDWISTQPDLDTTRVMVKGSSSGGYLALSVAQTFPTRISAVLSYIATTHLATFIERSANNEPEAWRRELGDERDKKIRERDKKIRDFFEKTAPVNNAHKIEKPSFLIIGGKDLMSSASETERIVSVLRGKGIPVWYLLAKDEGHSLEDIWIYNYAFNAQVLFVKRYLISESVQ